MRHLTCAILILVSNLTYGQLVSKNFDHISVFDDFSTESGMWSVKANGREEFSIHNEKYILKRKSETFFSVSMPETFVDYTSCEIAAKFEVISDKNNPKASGGLIFMAQRTGNGALALELNANRQFRFLILRNGAMQPMFPERNDGWVSSADIKKNKGNLVSIKIAAGSYDLFINGRYQQSFIDESYASGAVGFYINANSTLEVDFIKISQEEPRVTADRPEDIDAEDIEDETYSQLIQLFKDKIDNQQNEINRLRRELSVCKSSLNIDTTARKQNSELRKENRDLKDRIHKVEANLTRAQTRLEYLESMKKDIENSENGDLVIGLTELLSGEKKKNKELREKIAELEATIDTLKKGN